MFENLLSLCGPGQDKSDTPPPSFEDAASFPECDYEKNPTNLYKEIQAGHWVAVSHFLLTGYWHGNFFSDAKSPKEQACTWVTKYEDRSGGKRKVVWTHLPIHAAIIHGAPDGLIKLLIKLSSASICCADDQRMLPLHLAFRHGSSDAIITQLLEEFPDATIVRDFEGRLPPECAEDGPKPGRGRIIKTILDRNQKVWEKKAAKMGENEINTVKASLKLSNQKVKHLETALDLAECRENQTRACFSLVVSELQTMKKWHEQHTSETNDDASINASLIEQTSKKLADLQELAEGLESQQHNGKDESKKALSELNGIWQKAKEDLEKASEESAPSSEKRDEIEEEKKPNPEKSPIEVPKEESANPASSEIPEIISVEQESEEASVESSRQMSKMTSTEMSDDGGSKGSKRMQAIKNGLKKMTSTGKKASGRELPPKAPTNPKKNNAARRPKMNGRKLKISPTL